MSDLSNQTPADTYKGLLQVNGYTDGIAGNTGSNALVIQDGAGNATALAISTDNVGIGTTSPAARLEVKSPVDLHMRVGNVDQETSPIIRFQGQSSVGQKHYADIQLDAETGTLLLKDPGNSASGVGESPVAIDSDGNVGIGTTSPDEKLHVSGNAIITGDLNVSGTTTTLNTQTLTVENHQIILGTLSSGTPTDLTADGGGIVLKGDTDKTILWSNSDDAWRCNQNFIADGNVGIGTTSPDAKLEISGGGTGVWLKTTNITNRPSNTMAGQNYINLTNQLPTDENSFEIGPGYINLNRDDNVPINQLSFGMNGMLSAAFEVGGTTNSDHSLRFKVGQNDSNKAGIERMRISSSGNVGIGTPTPSHLLSVFSTGASSSVMRIVRSTSPANESNYLLNITEESDSHSTLDMQRADGLSAIRIRTSGDTYFNGGNVGIGTTSPSNKLDITANSEAFGISITNPGLNPARVTLTNGEGSGSIDANNGLLRLGNSTSEDLVINSDGNVGIGTTNPICTLHVDSSLDGPIFDSGGTGNSNHALLVRDSASNQLLRVDNNGNVGIGTTSPAAPLEISSTQPALRLSDTSTGTAAVLSSNNQGSLILNADLDNGQINSNIQCKIDGIEKMRIDSDGNVGIGTANPAFTLPSGHAVGPMFGLKNSLSASISLFRDDTSIVNGNAIGGMFFYGNGSTDPASPVSAQELASIECFADEAHDDNAHGSTLNFRTNNGTTLTDRMRIDKDGNVGIGTTSPDAKLHIEGNGGLVAAKIKNTTSGDSALKIENSVGQFVISNQNGFLNTLDNTSGTPNSRMTIDPSGNVGIGTTSPGTPLTIKSSAVSSTDSAFSIVSAANSSAPIIKIAEKSTEGCRFHMYDGGVEKIAFHTDGTDNFINAGNVGIGTTSPEDILDLTAATHPTIFLHESTNSYQARIGIPSATGHIFSSGASVGALAMRNDSGIQFGTNTPVLTINSSGNVGIGTTSPDTALHISTASPSIRLTDTTLATNTVSQVSADSDGVGSLLLAADITNVGTDPFISARVGGLGVADEKMRIASDGNVTPGTNDSQDFGSASLRWDDIYATNTTIQSSDRELKQDIEELTEAETRVAQACKGLLRKYRWKSSVEEKGDEARIHFGIIAQDLEAAFAAEGLDAGRYGMFVKNTWWTADRVIPAVEAVEAVEAVYDEEGNEVSPAVEAVEAQPEKTVTDIFNNSEDAPEGATEVTERGVRYSELLAFIIAAAA